VKISPVLLTSLTALAALSMAGCGSSGSQETNEATGNPASYGDCPITGKKGSFDLETLADGELLVKADLPSPGWYNGDTVADIDSGFDFCLLANIAHRAGIEEVKLQQTSFDGLVAGKAGDFDLSLNQITITDERRQVMDFSDPYFQSTAGILAKADSEVSAENLTDQTLGVKQGTVGQLLVRDVIAPAADPSVFPGDPEMQAAVAAGRVDAGIQDLSIVLGAASNSGGALEVVGQIETDEAYGIMLPKDSPNTAVVNDILAELQADGTLDELSAEYLTDAYGVDPASIPVWDVS
jgi:polar amino acid transport system substrate-binding protein